MAFQGVSLSLPDSSLFKFPPGTGAGFVPPPPPGTTSFAPPIAIPDHVYQAVLDPKVPITIAAVYAVTAKALNIYNKSTGKKPWAISKTLAFRWFVIAHNIFLAVYSAWTWWGMFNALRRTVVSPMGPHGFAATMDSMCQINGPKGFGNSVFWDEESSKWMTLSDGVLTESAAPSQFEAGRMWNEGLAFYGWLFYLSKFYEVFDTLIILAKGKLSSTLQTYHHAGAMMCMWAGMRYMSVPIWIFVFFNSFIHAIMYTYYSVTAFKIRVPMFIKRSLTSMQITQFLVGGSGAMIHSFISYNIPVGAGSRTAEAASSASAVANSSAATGSVIGSVNGAFEHKTMPCITSSGTTFAIWLNVFYLTPLTYLFVAFFIESYLRRSNAASSKSNGSKDSNIAAIGEKAAWEAADGVKREVYGESKESVKKSNGRVLRSRQ